MARAKPKEEKVPKIEGQIEDTPEGWAKYWAIEFRAAREEGTQGWPGFTSFHERGRKTFNRFLDNRKSSRRGDVAKLNLFTSNVQTLRALLFGNTPKCDVSRRFNDASDDDARLAAEILERVLNSGLEDDGNPFSTALRLSLGDRLLCGLGSARVHFSSEFVVIPETPAQMGPCPSCAGSGEVAASPMAMAAMAPPMAMGEPSPCPDCQGTGQIERAPAVPAREEPTNESCDPSYIHWSDQLWSPCRTRDEMRWWAEPAMMSRKDLVKAFGPDGNAIPMNAGKGRGSEKEGKRESPWSRAEVWEVWDKERRRVHYYVEGYGKTLTHKDNPTGGDPLGLEEFWPFAAPLIANDTTLAYLPTPDFAIAQDLYDEADELTNRIRNIVKSIKVVGVYDRANNGIKRLLSEACENELIPIDNWANFVQKGGLKGAFDLMPLDGLMQVVVALVQQRNTVIELSYQITGMGDVVRGQQQQAETATTSAIKARFASVRLQDFQKEFARYATDLQRIRKEIIAKHYSVQTIIQRSNILQTDDGKDPIRVQRAAQLIKDRHLDFRVVVKPEQVALQDFAALKQQRGEVLQALGAYFQSMMPFIQFAAPAGPEAIQSAVAFVLKTAQWMIAGLPGASGVESAFDEFTNAVEKISTKAAASPPQPRPPDPALQTAQVKAGAETTKAQLGVVQAVVDAKAHAEKTALDVAKARMEHAHTMQSEEAQQRTEAMKAMSEALPAPAGGAQ